MANPISALLPGLEGLGLSGTQNQGRNNRLGQEEFFQLMITQLKNQDPLNPMENGEFLAQLSQFGTVSGIGDLQKSFSLLANSLQSSQALQASTMVGRSVLVEGSRVTLGSGTSSVSGAVDLPQASSEVMLYVEDAAGQVVRQISLGGHDAGVVPFTWEGLADLGGALPPGTYQLKAQAVFDDSGPQAVGTLLRQNVESVTIPGNGEAPLLNLSDRRQVSLSDVREVM